MSKIHISQFYPCSSIELACELYYVCELGKYLQFNYGDCISLDGVLLNSNLNKSPLWDLFRLSVDKGWVVDSAVNEDELSISVQNPLEMDMQKVRNVLYVLNEVPFDRNEYNMRRDSLEYAFCNPEKLQVSFEVLSDEYWLWSINGKDGKNFVVNNKSMSGNLASQSWLSLIAMVAVTRLKTGKPNNLLLKFSKQTTYNVMALSYIMLLDDKTNCLHGWCHYNIDDTVTNQELLQLGYTSWYAEGKDKGYLSRWYSGKEKVEYLKHLDIREGDLVMFYERYKAQKANYIKSIASCHLAKVLSINSRGISLELINTVKTKFQGKEDFDDKTIVVKKMFLGNKPYEVFNTSVSNLDINDCGVEYMMYLEKYFIVPLDKTDDLKIMRVTDGVRKDTLRLEQNDAVYWILKDYDYEFNEERFLEKYFPNSEPAYTRYMRGEVLEDYYYIKEV